MCYRINLRHLFALRLIAEKESISAAAGLIGLSQPALTQGLSKLERQFGVRLFDRLPGRLSPTVAGARVLSRINRAVDIFAAEINALPGAKRRGRRLELRATASHVRALLALAGGDNGKQPATTSLSMQRSVMALERAVGVALIERLAGGMALTAVGRIMARGFALGMAELDMAFQETQRQPARVAVGAMALSRSRIIPEALAQMSVDEPHTEIDVVDGSYGDLVEALQSGALDMMIGTLRENPGNDLRQVILLTDRITVIGRRGHPLADAVCSMAQLGQFSWVVGRRTSALLEHWQQIFDHAGVARPRAPIHCGSVTVIRGLLVRSDFLTLLSRDQVQAELEAGLLTVIASEVPETVRVIGAITRKDWFPTPAQERFLALLRQIAVRMQDGTDT